MTKRKGDTFEHNPSGGEPERASGSSTFVFYGDPQLVSDAFALALNAMERAGQFGVSGGPRRSRKRGTGDDDNADRTQ
jgi:hypothetical protein